MRLPEPPRPTKLANVTTKIPARATNVRPIVQPVTSAHLVRTARTRFNALGVRATSERVADNLCKEVQLLTSP
jgi:hypothetical protein